MYRAKKSNPETGSQGSAFTCCKGSGNLPNAETEQSQGFWQELLQHQQKPLLHLIDMHQGSAAPEFMAMFVLQSQQISLKTREESQNLGF